MFDRLINTLEESCTFNDENEILDEELDTLLDEEECAVKNGHNPKITTSVGIDPAKEEHPVTEALVFNGKGEIKRFNPKEMAVSNLEEGLGFADDVEKYIDSFGRKAYSKDEMEEDMSLQESVDRALLIEGFDEEDTTEEQSTLQEGVDYSIFSEAISQKRFDKPYAQAEVQKVLERKNDKMKRKGYLPLTGVNSALKAEIVKLNSQGFNSVKVIKLAGVICLHMTLNGGKPFDFVHVAYYNKETNKVRFYDARCTIREKKLKEDIQHIELLDEERNNGIILEDYTNDNMEAYHLLEEDEKDITVMNYPTNVVMESLGMNVSDADVEAFCEGLGENVVVKRSADLVGKAASKVGSKNGLQGQLPYLPTDAGTAVAIITNSMHLVPRNANAIDVESTKKFLNQYMQDANLEQRGLRLYDASIDSEALNKALKSKKLKKNIADFFKMFLSSVVLFTVTCPQLRAKLGELKSAHKADKTYNKNAKDAYDKAVESKDEVKIAVAKQGKENREKHKHSALTAYTTELINEYAKKDENGKVQVTDKGKSLGLDVAGVGLKIAGLTLAWKIFIKKLDYFLFKIGDMTLITFYNKDAVSMNSHIYPGYLVLVDRAKGNIVFENVNVYGRHVE